METGDKSNIIGSLVEGHPLEARTPIMLELSPVCAPAAARGPIASHIERVEGGSDLNFYLGVPTWVPGTEATMSYFREYFSIDI